MRWIVFDEETAEAVVSKYRRGAAEIHEHDQPLDAALNAGSRSILILPSPEPNRVLLATIVPKTTRPASKPRRDPVIGQFTPLRGVVRRTTLLPPPTPPQKTWWRRWTA